MISNATLHYTILKEIIANGFAPDVKTLAQLLDHTEKEVGESLYRLQEYHGVVLHPNEAKVWVIHPFALAPTNFYVQSKDKAWWGNCAWCSLGVAALIKTDCTITTTLGGETEQVKIHIENGEVQEKDFYIHFPIPMKKAWDNVIYTCSNMLVFENEQQIDTWSKKHDITKGDFQSINKVWQFSKKWYGNHLNPNWEKWTVDEARLLFTEFGLKHSIWDLGKSNERF